ncbi:MAG: hypothetical protein QM669_05055 [Siphonobacter sp.]
MPNPSRELINHEKIHLKQALELLVFPFYTWYVGLYGWYRLQGKTAYEAYHALCFEREAYAHEHDLDYLKRRKRWAFWHYLKK